MVRLDCDLTSLSFDLYPTFQIKVCTHCYRNYKDLTKVFSMDINVHDKQKVFSSSLFDFPILS